MKSIAFIMPSYNRANFIAESISTIIPQMRAQDTLTVVDDGSTDNTSDIIRNLEHNITFIRQENAGKSVALNLGLAATESDYVWICDDDDLLRPNVVPMLLNQLEEQDSDLILSLIHI